jgi:diadenosine tetraphosphate (Ap4A) HIT family hydrolase
MIYDSYGPACEFCSELRPPYLSRFHSLFGSILPERTVLVEGGFVAIPSMGQIVADSLMLLPLSHVERFADLDTEDLQTAENLVGRLRAAASGPVAIFEHGARSCTGGSCGIYHAHIHLIPLPDGLPFEQLAVGLAPTTGSFRGAMEAASIHDQYLFLWDGGFRMWLRSVSSDETQEFPSQHFRRVLASAVGLHSSWDWRRTTQPEPALVAAYHSWMHRLPHSSAFGRTMVAGSC